MSYLEEQGLGRFDEVQVGDEVTWRAPHGNRVFVASVERVSTREGRLTRAWLDDGSSWSARGVRWGDGGSWRTTYARRIVDRERFDEARREEEEARLAKNRLLSLSSDLRNWVPLNLNAFSEEELRDLRSAISRAKVRASVASFCDQVSIMVRFGR